MTTETAKTPRELAAEERARINVTTPTGEKEAEKTDEKVDAKDDKKDDDKDTKEEDKEVVEEEDNEEEKETGEKEEEEKAPDPVKLQKTIERMQKRIDSLTAKSK